MTEKDKDTQELLEMVRMIDTSGRLLSLVDKLIKRDTAMKPHELVETLDKKSFEQLARIHAAFVVLAEDFPEVYQEFDGLSTFRNFATRAYAMYGAEI